MKPHDASAMPPLLIRPSLQGEHAPDMLLAPWLPLDRPLRGRMWCDVSSPAGTLHGNHVDFPAGCGPSEAIEAILRQWQGEPDPVAAWLDGDRPEGAPRLAPPTSMSRDAWGRPVPPAVLPELPGSGGRMCLVSGEAGATLLLDDGASTGGPRTLVARDGDVACLRRSRHAAPEWTVLPGLGPEGTYWAFANWNGFAAMRAVALHLADAHATADATDDALAVLAHAALKLRYLGPGFRERAVGILARHATDDLDVAALSWCLSVDNVGRDRLPDRTEWLCEALRSRRPAYTATLDCLGSRLWTAIGRREAAGGTYGGPLAEALEALNAAGAVAQPDHALLVLDYDI